MALFKPVLAHPMYMITPCILRLFRVGHKNNLAQFPVDRYATLVHHGFNMNVGFEETGVGRIQAIE